MASHTLKRNDVNWTTLNYNKNWNNKLMFQYFLFAFSIIAAKWGQQIFKRVLCYDKFAILHSGNNQ